MMDEHICNGDTPGYRRVVDEKGNGTCTPCPGCRLDRLRTTLRAACGVPRRHESASLTAPALTPAQGRARDALIERGTADALLHGPPGTGKTWLACASVLGRVARAEPAVYVSLATALARDRAAAQLGTKRVDWTAMAAAPGLLVLDELLPVTEWERAITDMLIVSRYEDCLETLVVTNGATETLRGILSPHTFDRLRTFRRIVLDTESVR